MEKPAATVERAEGSEDLNAGFKSVLAALVLAAAGSSAAYAQARGAADLVFTVANFPVEAKAQDAVTAKERAMADGQQAAFRTLLKRLVPVTLYSRIKAAKTAKAGDFLDGVSVRSERNSTTEYIASLDFTFQAEAVRSFLRREGIPFIDTQAKPVTVVVLLKGADGKVADSKARPAKAWADAWAGLDVEHALAPVKIEHGRAVIHADTIAMLQKGDGGGLRVLAGEYKTDRIIAAIAEVDSGGAKLHVTLSGEDAVGPLVLKRSYRMAGGDMAYAMELAAIVALGTLEGRWKTVATKARGGIEVLSGPAEGFTMLVEFRSMRQWQDMRRVISETPGVENFVVGGLSARGADVSLRFPGGAEHMADAVSAQGMTMAKSGGTWVLRPNW